MSWEADFDVDEVFKRAAGEEEAAGELNEKSKVRLPSSPFTSSSLRIAPNVI